MTPTHLDRLQKALRHTAALAIAVALLIASTPLHAQDEAAESKPSITFLPLEEMPLPPAEDFLSRDINLPRDWIVLNDGKVVPAIPLVPRPNTIAIREKQLSDKQAEGRGLTGAKRETWLEELRELQGLSVTIPELEPEPEYRIPLDQIDRVIHHEDLWLQRIGKLIEEGKIETSLELLARLQSHRADWPGTEERVTDLIFADAKLRLAAGNREEALMLLEETARRRADYPGIAEQAGLAVDEQIAAALAGDDYRQARYFLTRLNSIAPNAPVFQKYTADLAAKASGVLAEAQAAREAGNLSQASELADRAARIWPDTQGLASFHKSIVERYQRVRVGVTDLPGAATSYPFETAADERRRHLTEIPLFEVYEFQGGAARYRTRFFDEWMPYDLGRTTRFTLRQTRQPWEAQPVLLGWPITDRIRERLDPSHPRFDERLAGYVESMTVESPFEFTISFKRVPPRLEALFTDAIVRAPAGGESSGDPSAAAPTDALPQGAFQLVERMEDKAVYRRFFLEPEGTKQFHVSEIVEMKYSDPESAFSGLVQGEVHILPTPPLWIIRRLQEEESLREDFFIQQHAIPETHVLQFNPATPVLRSRELRRALLYGVNRRGILDSVMLKQPAGEQGRLIAGPFPQNSRANAVGVTPREFDPYAGLALALAARNALATNKVIEADLPKLRMLVPPNPTIREAADQIIAGWARIGIDVEIVPDDDVDAWKDGRWDLVYRRVQLTEPIVQLWPFLTLNNTARIDDLTIVPDWLKQEIVALDRSSDWSRAEDRVKELHRHLWLEAAMIPLWELDQYSVYRKTVRNFPVNPIYPYDNVDQWTLEASLDAVGP